MWRHKSTSRDGVGCGVLAGTGWDVETDRRVLAGVGQDLVKEEP